MFFTSLQKAVTLQTHLHPQPQFHPHSINNWLHRLCCSFLQPLQSTPCPRYLEQCQCTTETQTMRTRTQNWQDKLDLPRQREVVLMDSHYCSVECTVKSITRDEADILIHVFPLTCRCMKVYNGQKYTKRLDSRYISWGPIQQTTKLSQQLTRHLIRQPVK